MEAIVAAAYRRCRELHRIHGRSYYLATKLLPRRDRWHVHALYGFTRHADDLVDHPGADPALALTELGKAMHAGLADPTAVADHPLLPAFVQTARELRWDPADLDLFLSSMAMDLTVTAYPTYCDLLGYMDGSAAVIGTLLLPILRPTDLAAAREPARQLGLAFQLTNFLRDVGEDLDRGRVYLPAEDLARFGVSRATLRSRTPAVRQLIRYEVGRAREHYELAAAGVAVLPPASARCVRVAHAVYGAILDEIESADYDVFSERITVPAVRRLRLAAAAIRSSAA
ncbi:phytoene synthase [Allocatelliglobosispora scoriae]|uniref:Phytoene synthase n=1 Tax=Allocatelliglobosispora scoriae TaxID=643052 RepID=A0A841BSZ5_9ACTN|nr:phytoene/squalene synthase family protein [Allocatelliglobosispora scoriae]MBB5870825.1 phytoene synthase [Allocatelliglobosispora scoriae]